MQPCWGGTVEAVCGEAHEQVAAFESEWSQSRTTLASLDLDSMIVADGEPVRAIRLVVDVLQESARHLGHIDILRELIDGVRGE